MGLTQIQDDRSSAIFSFLLEVTEAANEIAKVIGKKKKKRHHEKPKEDIFYNLTRGFIYEDTRYSMVLIHGRNNKIPGFVVRINSDGLMQFAWLDHYSHGLSDLDISQLWYESVASVDAVSDAFTSWFLEITPLPQISKHVFPFASLQPSADAMATVLA